VQPIEQHPLLSFAELLFTQEPVDAAREAYLRGEQVLFPPGTYWLTKFAKVPCEVEAPFGVYPSAFVGKLRKF
jgi:hypothetical protein